ncbi:MAG: nucleotide exchange factor GrpE [Bacteroidia bacterium]|nr:nucleotide exchange factor GrpE [Bacteroidia bacterium]
MNSEETNKEEIVDTENNSQTENTDSIEENPVSEPSAETAEDTKAVLTDADALQAEKDRYMRLYSEFENFRRRTARERMDLLQTAGKDVISLMLPVVDDLERALKASEGAGSANAEIIEGFKLIAKKMTSTLEGLGLKPMNAQGAEFDAEIHEAVTKIPAPDASLKGKVVDELEKGYFLNDKVIRFAKVVVGE